VAFPQCMLSVPVLPRCGPFLIEVHDYSGTMMTTPLPTTKTTTWPTNTNLNICSTLNNSSQNVRPSPKFKIVLDDSALACWSVEFGFGFHRTAHVDVVVEPVSEHVLRLSAPSPSSTPHVQLLNNSSLTPPENTLDNPSFLRAI